MQQEIEAYGKPSVTENFEYVANQVSSELDCTNGVRDKGRTGLTIDDWVADPRALKCNIKKPEMVALRVYTTATFKDINDPLRDQKRYFLFIINYIYIYTHTHTHIYDHLHLALRRLVTRSEKVS